MRISALLRSLSPATAALSCARTTRTSWAPTLRLALLPVALSAGAALLALAACVVPDSGERCSRCHEECGVLRDECHEHCDAHHCPSHEADGAEASR